MLKFLIFLTFLVLIFVDNLVNCFDLKLGWLPSYYQTDDEVMLYVNKVESDTTQLPYAYYDLPFVCPPSKEQKPVHLSLGEVIRGDRIWSSDYHIFFEKDEPCKRICDRITKPEGIRKADELIRKGYVAEWIIDSLPGATTFISSSTNSKYYAAGFPLGFVQDGKTYLHNHVMLVIRWHKENDDPNKKTIVGFEVYPRSVSDFHCPGASKSFANFELDLNQKEEILIPFTYAVYWREETDVSWHNRWNLYFSGELDQDRIHVASLFNSLVLVLLLSTIVGVVLLRTLNRDITNHKKMKHLKNKTTRTLNLLKPVSQDSFAEEVKNMLPNEDRLSVDPSTAESSLPINTINNNNIDSNTASTGTNITNITSSTSASASATGWKLLLNEVFSQPEKPLVLSVLAGSGIQLLVSLILVSALCASGLLGPAHRGSVITVSYILFVFSGFTSGYSGVQFYKKFVCAQTTLPNWLRVSAYCGGGLTCFVFFLLFTLNLFVWINGSSVALPFGTIVFLIAGLVILEIPLAIFGGFLSNRHASDSLSLSVMFNKSSNGLLNNTPIPRQPWYNRLYFAVPLFGIIPFSIIYVELVFIFKSVFLEKTSFYYMYEFLVATIILLIVVIIEITIVSIYLALNKGDYRWQWRSFIIGGASISFYIFIYGIYYFVAYLNVVDFLSVLLYFSYIIIISAISALACGSIGLISSVIFISRIYSAIKV
ncbi:hypothetical protein PACTADRAFT_51808, partial [Pachysolen tannophilus NRRL Y-2460]